eukprot:g27933.t1
MAAPWPCTPPTSKELCKVPGLVPGASIFFAFRSERVFAQALKQSVGVPIYNLKHSDFLNFAKDAPEYRELLDTLFERLQEPKLAPSNDEDLRRLLAAKDVDTQVLIETWRVLYKFYSPEVPYLKRPSPEKPCDRTSTRDLDQWQEQEMLRKIGDEVKRCWFGDAKGDFDRSYGRQAAGYLGHKIWRHLDERAKNLCHQRFVQFSCHDTTMCALAAHFGIELDKIGFGAFFALELHECPDGSGSHFVKFYYNPEPDLGAPSYEGLQPLVLPLGREEKIRPIKETAFRLLWLHLMEDHCRIEGLEESFEDFVKLLGRADLGPTRSDLLKLLEDGRNGWHDFNEWKELYEEAFHSFDQNGDGLLCKAEMQDRYALSKEDVYLAMFALVGVRGSISSKTVNKDVLVDILLDDPNQRSGGGVTMLMSAANTGDLNRIRTLVQQGAEVNAQDDFGWTSLRFAVRKGHVEAVQELIEANADVNLCSESGRTPLMSAVANASPNIVQLLVSAGADLEAKNGQGESPWVVALQRSCRWKVLGLSIAYALAGDGLTAFDIAKRGGGMGNTVIRGLVDPKTSLVVTG